MSTSDESPDGIRGFLTSRPNVVGVVALLVVFLAVVLVSQSPGAALLAAFLGYGAGYLLTPETRKTYASGIPVHGATRDDMNNRLSEFQSTVRENRSRLPPAADQEFSTIGRYLHEMIDRWESVAPATEQRMVLESIVYQYLPNTLEVFLEIPDTAKPAAAPEWIEQLRVLRNEVARSRNAVFQHNLEAMRTNGRLLEQKFEDGELKIFRENGL